MASDLTLTFRKHALAECEKCPLQQEGQFVPSVGPAKAQLAIVGEAPGVNEARSGEPFIGDSGQLLNRVLSHFKYSRKDVFLTNACLCRRPDGATPNAASIAACRPRLIQELHGREVQDVVALGNSAAQAVLSTKVGITRLRIGQGHTNQEDLPGVRVLCTFHPAAALRSPDFFPSIVNDFGKLRGFSASWYEPRWRAYEYPDEALAALAELQKIPGDIVIDIEAGIEKDVSFEQPSRHTLLCIGIEFEKGRVVVIGETALRDPRVIEALILYLTTHRLKAQNGKFDCKGLQAKLKVMLKLFADTMLKHYTLDERQGVHSLEYLGVELLGTPMWKGMLDKYKGPKDSYAVIPRPVLYKYCAFDVHVTWLVDEILDKMMGPDQVKLHEHLIRVSNMLQYTELNGIAVDLAYNSQLAVDYQASLDVLEGQIGDAIPEDKWDDAWARMFPARANKIQPFNPRSPKQVKEVIKGIYKLQLPTKLNTRKEYAETTDVEALTGLLERTLGTPAEEFFRRMLEHRKEAKLYGTYVKGLRNRVYRGRVYPTFLLHGTTTGRLSCRNPNLQNIPRDSSMRRQFIPSRAGNVFVEGDFGQAELRVLCWLAQDEYLRSVFNDPTRDLFDELTPRLYGNVGSLTPAERKELRIRVKAYVYGVSYGRTEYSIALEFKIPTDEAARGMNEFFKVIPATVSFRERTRLQVLQGRDLVTFFGRHRRFHLITNQNKKDVMNEALAFLPQSTASDICLDAAVELRPKLKGIGYIRNLVHDSQLVECAEKDVEEVRALMVHEMLESAKRVVGDYVAFKVDTKIGHNWGDLH